MARRASGSLALCYLPCPCAAPVVPYRSDAEHPTQRLARSGDSLRGGHLRYPARRTLAWHRASRTAGPSTSGGRFVCWLVGSTKTAGQRPRTTYRSGCRPGLVILLTSTVGMITALGRATGTILGSRRPSQEQMVGGTSYAVPFPRAHARTSDLRCWRSCTDSRLRRSTTASPPLAVGTLLRTLRHVDETGVSRVGGGCGARLPGRPGR